MLKAEAAAAAAVTAAEKITMPKAGRLFSALVSTEQNCQIDDYCLGTFLLNVSFSFPLPYPSGLRAIESTAIKLDLIPMSVWINLATLAPNLFWKDDVR